MNRSTSILGFWSALVAANGSIGFSVAAVLAQANLLPDPLYRILEFVPSLLLAPAFVVLIVCIHYAAPQEKRLWSHASLAIAIMYAVLVSIAYVSQLMVVIPYELRGEGSKVAVLAWGDGTFLTWIDGFGYTLMSVATLLAAPVFSSRKLERWIRGFFIANGCLAPFIFLAGIYPVFLAVGALWMITIPASMILLCALFGRAGRAAPGEESN